METIINYYNKYDEEPRLMRTKANTLEFETTKYLLKDYIKESDTILETGAGTGRYSFYYANEGNCVTATDLVPRHIEIMKNKALEKKMNNLTIGLANATNLEEYADESFDVVLCLGPMYHLTAMEDRENCIKENLRVLKPGGILAVAYINKHYILSNLLFEDKKFLNNSFIDKVLTKGYLSENDGFNFWTDSCYFTPREIEEFLVKFSINKLENAATDGLGRLLPEKVNNLTDQEFEIYKNYHFKSCREESLVGYSNHALYIGRKSL
ncbi:MULTISPECIES: class I SAM-dependent methyltransferase [Psychrilyobacter]|uniref:Methyltransferase domain-containing protein n=1 Tax=Psychrilyobacter piezotolerans TaxID=2293438 RepID=A0ABX9KKU3_9FUSO|nr:MULTISPECIES: class I SAM-dependent methyltransferase [Psychrilyobacter]MCS5421095.1 class I SAM-dependent methyltransferase [Psychrilyobacter sp. S5]NDI76787.1 class I SAM-dependent methyltransferase [Psychrilyobacter piezotolerans]RDE65071.1 class I SAM-dependent methyltransferase [Psychrilyobacter sp. S5]REI42641.1 methyltransferase domain-containing protein [Psychrilyobacter piezotolerans]